MSQQCRHNHVVIRKCTSICLPRTTVAQGNEGTRELTDRRGKSSNHKLLSALQE